MKVKQKLKRDFSRPPFLLSVIFTVVMVMIVALGNPKSGGFYYHFIPEIFAIYCFGVWARQVKFSLRMVLIVAVFATILVPLLLGNLLGILISGWLSASLVLGYLVERSIEGKTLTK